MVYNGNREQQGGIVTPYYYSYQTEAAYSDLGPDGTLGHRGVLRMMQEAAALESDDRGYGFKDAETKHAVWILAGWRLELLKTLPWREKIEIRTWPRRIEGFLSERDFLAYANGVLTARASSRWFLVDPGTGKITRVTEAVRSAYEFDSTAAFAEPLPTNGKSPAEAEATFTTVVGRRDIDTNRHVNNIHYLDYAMEALPEETAAFPPSTVEAVFRHQILCGTRIRCLYSFSQGRHMVEIQSGSGENLVHHAYLWFY